MAGLAGCLAALAHWLGCWLGWKGGLGWLDGLAAVARVQGTLPSLGVGGYIYIYRMGWMDRMDGHDGCMGRIDGMDGSPSAGSGGTKRGLEWPNPAP